MTVISHLCSSVIKGRSFLSRGQISFHGYIKRNSAFPNPGAPVNQFVTEHCELFLKEQFLPLYKEFSHVISRAAPHSSMIVTGNCYCLLRKHSGCSCSPCNVLSTNGKKQVLSLTNAGASPGGQLGIRGIFSGRPCGY